MESIFIIHDNIKYMKLENNALYHIYDINYFFFNCKNLHRYDYEISSIGKWDDKNKQINISFESDKLSYKDALYYYTIAENNEFFFNRMKKRINERIKLL